MDRYGLEKSSEAMRGGKICPGCGEPMSRQARFCRECTIDFKNFLRKAYKRDVIFTKVKKPTGGRAAVGRQSRRRTLIALRNRGPSTARELAMVVNMTDQGVREQLNIMKKTGEVIQSKEGHKYVWEARVGETLGGGN